MLYDNSLYDWKLSYDLLQQLKFHFDLYWLNLKAQQNILLDGYNTNPTATKSVQEIDEIVLISLNNLDQVIEVAEITIFVTETQTVFFSHDSVETFVRWSWKDLYQFDRFVANLLRITAANLSTSCQWWTTLTLNITPTLTIILN